MENIVLYTIYVIAGAFGLFIFFLFLRELVCWQYRINDRLSEMQKMTQELTLIREALTKK